MTGIGNEFKAETKPTIEHMHGIAPRESVLASDLCVKLSKKGMRPASGHLTFTTYQDVMTPIQAIMKNNAVVRVRAYNRN